MTRAYIDWDRLESIGRAATAEPPVKAGRTRRRRREPVPVNEARAAYDRLGSWRRVAEVLCRSDGSKFTSNGIAHAVQWADKGNAGYRTA